LGEEGEIDSDSNDEGQESEDEKEVDNDKRTSGKIVRDVLPKMDKCGSFYLDFMTNLKWIKAKQEASHSKTKNERNGNDKKIKKEKSDELDAEEELFGLEDSKDGMKESLTPDLDSGDGEEAAGEASNHQRAEAVKENVALSYSFTDELRKSLQAVKTCWKETVC